MKILIAGGDTYVNHVLRAYVEIMLKKSRDGQMFNFFIIPLGIIENNIYFLINYI